MPVGSCGGGGGGGGVVWAPPSHRLKKRYKLLTVKYIVKMDKKEFILWL